MIALLLSVAPVHGWVAKSQSIYGAQISEIQALMRGERVLNPYGTERVPQAQLGYLWHMPENTNDTRGMGGGITWAFDPQLCNLLDPLFQEDVVGFSSFVNCPDYKSAIARAFDKWSANNRFIKFLDVSNECEANGQLYGPPTEAVLGQGRPAQTGMPHGGCPLAEIWVTALEGFSGDNTASSRRRLHVDYQSPTIGPDGQEMETPDGLPPLVDDFDIEAQTATSFAVATAQPHPRYAYDFRYTNGARPYWATGAPAQGPFYRPVVETYAGTFKFNANVDQVCWYLDSQFCYRFHLLKIQVGTPEDARLLVYGITLGCTVLGVLFYIGVICAVCLRFTGDGEAIDDEDGDGKLSCGERVRGSMREISHYNPMCLTLFLGLLFIPPLITVRIFRPCFDCYDFEAAALHEIGHFLGLGHPDNIPSNWAYPTYSFAGPTPGNNSYQSLIASAMLAEPPAGQTRPPPPDDSFCRDPWAGVVAGIPPNQPAAETRGPNTQPLPYSWRSCQMEALTQHNPLTCLRDDDLEGLQVLYPDCGPYALFSNVCHIVDLNIGLVRSSVYVLIPWMFCLFIVVTFNSIMHGFEKREQKRLLEMNSSLMEEAKAAKKKHGQAAKAAQVVVLEKAKAEARMKKKMSSMGGIGAESAQVNVNVGP